MAILLLLGSASTRVDPILDDYDRFQEEIYDQPKELLKRTGARLETLNPDTDPIIWTKTLVQHLDTLSASDGMVSEFPRLTENLEKAKALAQTHGLHAQMIRLMDMEIDQARQSKNPPTDAEIVAHYEKAFAYADANHVLREKALMMAYFSNYLVEMGHGVDSLKTLNDAMKSMKSDPKTTEFDVLIVQGYMAVSMWYLGDYEKFLSYMELIDVFCQKRALRSFCSTQLYNLGLYFVENQTRRDFDRAEGYFERSIELAKGINDQHDIALCRYGLGTLYLRQKRWNAAEKLLQEARQMFARWDDSVFIAKTLVNLSEAQMGQGQYQETLHTLTEARQFMRPEMKRDLNRIDELTYQVYKRSDRKLEALAALETYVEGFKKVSEDLQKREYSKAVTTMGLQIEEAKNKALQAENDRKTTAALVLAVLLILVAFSMFVAVRRGKQVRAAKEKMQQILDTIDEGILSVSTDLTIVDEHSPFIQQIFPQQKLAGESVVEAIFRPSTLNPEEITMAEQALRACLGEDIIAWEFNAVHLPKAVHRLDGRSLALHWMPIADGQHIRRLLLAIRDITEQKMLQEKLEQQQNKVNRLQRKITEVLSGKFQEVKRLLERFGRDIPTLQKNLSDGTEQPSILRSLHTVKGEARSLGLRDLSLSLHHLEDACRATGTVEREEAMHAVQEQWREYQHLVNNVFSLPQGESRDEDQLLDVLAPLASTVRRQSLQSGLGFAGFEVIDHVEQWTLESLQTARSVLVHGLTNAMDHGYLLPLQNNLAVSRAWFQIEADEDNGFIHIKIRDQGVGLNWDALQKLARTRGFEPQAHESIVDIVFQDGLSTADKVTESSGRGVGLSAVRALCRELGGDAQLTSNDRGPGAMLLLRYRKA